MTVFRMGGLCLQILKKFPTQLQNMVMRLKLVGSKMTVRIPLTELLRSVKSWSTCSYLRDARAVRLQTMVMENNYAV